MTDSTDSPARRRLDAYRGLFGSLSDAAAVLAAGAVVTRSAPAGGRGDEDAGGAAPEGGGGAEADDESGAGGAAPEDGGTPGAGGDSGPGGADAIGGGAAGPRGAGAIGGSASGASVVPDASLPAGLESGFGTRMVPRSLRRSLLTPSATETAGRPGSQRTTEVALKQPCSADIKPRCRRGTLRRR